MSRIMVIDDDEMNRDLLRARLEAAGHEVHEAKDGVEGLALLETTPTDLILLDIMMPRSDGWQVCRMVKANPKLNRVPVVILSACTQNIDELRGYECGADDYIAKPWDPAHLRAVVDKLLKIETVGDKK
jgi:DNA-binding response OmpR family regulator